MIPWRVQYTRGAAENLNALHDYITFELRVPEYADGQRDHIEAAVEKLDQWPLRHAVYPNEPWKSRGVRYFAVDHYVILYYPDEATQTVTILRIMYYRQSPVQ